MQEQKNKLLSIRSFELLFIYISLVPFYYLPPISLPFINIKFPLFKYLPFLFISILSLAAYRYMSTNKKIIFRKNSINIFILIYFFVSIISALKSEYRLEAFAKTVYYTVTGVWLYFIVLTCNLDKEKIEKFFAMVVFVSAIVSGYGIITFLIGKDPLFTEYYIKYVPFFTESHLEKEGRISSTFANPGFLSTYLIMCLPLIFYQFKSVNILLKKPLKVTIGLILSLALLLTFSIWSLISVAIALFFYFLNRVTFREFIKRHHRMILFIFIIGLLIVIAVAPYYIEMGKYYYQDRLRTGYDRQDYILGRVHKVRILFHGRFIDRLIKFKFALKIIKNHSFLGAGLGTIGAGKAMNGIYSMDNAYLRLLAERGILAFLAKLILITLIITKVYRTWRRITDQDYANFLWLFLIIFVAFLINAFSCDIFYLPTHRIIFWIYCGIALSIIEKFSNSGKEARKN